MLTDRIEKTCNFIKLNVVENYKNIYNIQIQNNNKTIDDLKFDIHFSFKKHIIEISEVQIMKGGNNNENNNDKFDVNNQIIHDMSSIESSKESIETYQGGDDSSIQDSYNSIFESENQSGGSGESQKTDESNDSNNDSNSDNSKNTNKEETTYSQVLDKSITKRNQ